MMRSLTLHALDGSAAVIAVVGGDEARELPHLVITHHPDTLQAEDYRMEFGPDTIRQLAAFAREGEARPARPTMYGPISLVYTTSNGTSIDLARGDLAALDPLERALARAVILYAAAQLDIPPS